MFNGVIIIGESMELCMVHAIRGWSLASRYLSSSSLVVHILCFMAWCRELGKMDLSQHFGVCWTCPSCSCSLQLYLIYQESHISH